MRSTVAAASRRSWWRLARTVETAAGDTPTWSATVWTVTGEFRFRGTSMGCHVGWPAGNPELHLRRRPPRRFDREHDENREQRHAGECPENHVQRHVTI